MVPYLALLDVARRVREHRPLLPLLLALPLLRLQLLLLGLLLRVGALLHRGRRRRRAAARHRDAGPLSGMNRGRKTTSIGLGGQI